MSKHVRLIASAAALSVFFFSPSSAQQEVETRVIVPESPGGANFGGCYRANRDLFGPHRLTMCFERGWRPLRWPTELAGLKRRHHG